MALKSSTFRRSALGALLVLSSLLVGCNNTSDPGPKYPAGNSTINGLVIDQHIGAPVAGSTVTVLQNGSALGTFTTGSDGTFTVSNIAAGTYDLKARKTGMAGFDLYGLVVSDGASSVTLIERPAFDTSASTDGPKLTFTRADGSPLAGATFTDGVDFQIKTAGDTNHLPPMRIMYAQLGRQPGTATITSSTTANNWNWVPLNEDVKEVTSPAVKLPSTAFPNFIAGFGSATGEQLYLQIQAVDFNYNYVRYIVPITLINSSGAQKNTVVAPTSAVATAFTLKQEGSWTTPYSAPTPEVNKVAAPELNAAPSGSGVFVEVRWCYTNVDAAAKPFAFDIERSSDGTTFKKVGTVGGGSNADCVTAEKPLRPFNFKDTSSDLSVGQNYTYRVTARGANSAVSNLTSTTPLGQFSPVMVSPGDELTGVSTTPTLVIRSNQTEIGADGVGYNVRLQDLYSLTRYSMPRSGINALLRVEEGNGANGNGVPAGNSVVYVQTTSAPFKPTAKSSMATDTAGVYNAKKPNLIPVNTTTHELGIPTELFIDALQPLRPYQWEMYSAIAYKYQPSENNRISAYSVYAWGDPSTGGATIGPIYQTRPVTQSFDFITGEK